MQTLWREPQEFAAGDTLSFSRSLDDFRASQGWSLKYDMRGGSQPIEFISTATNDDHKILVLPAVTATWLPGDYTLAGEAINSGTGETHQIYLGYITITPNLSAMAGNAPAQTFAQQMLAQIEEVLLAKASGDLLESQVGDSRFKFLSMEELRTEHGYWKSVRANEIAIQNAKMGRPTGNKIRPRMNITGYAPQLGSGVWPWGGPS